MHCWIGILAVSCVLAAGCNRQTPPAPVAANASSSAPHDAHPPDPQKRTTLLGNLGNYHRGISSAVPQAQQFFDEGLTLLYGFNHEEAYRSFDRAAALDPKTFRSVTLRNMLRSWKELVEATESHDQVVNVVHGALRHYDLPDLIELAGAERVQVLDPAGVMGFSS